VGRHHSAQPGRRRGGAAGLLRRLAAARLLGFKRETHTEGWRFNGLILLKDDVVIYKLTGGQPVIQETENTQNPLGPVQSIGSKLSGGWL
jgi:hypothetical protein